ncbi:MAG: T9SS type A sorting domain-containing protein [Saprospiraceae bacterium]|nr:T9SS type A sorting domain-containing protein [Saprospiraceae bacterium]
MKSKKMVNRTRLRTPLMKGLILMVYLTLSSTLSGQALLSYDELGSISADSLTRLFAIPALNDVVQYRISYATLGSDNLPDTASGLFVLPLGRAKGIIAYQHGTTAAKDEVPSNLTLADAFIAIGYASQGYMCSAADYLGLGTSRGFHPYVHAETQSRAGLDMLLAMRELLSELEVDWPPNIFVSGYSQGGHAAMALARTIEERMTDDLWLTASAPMSGPYDISGGTRELILSDEEYDFVGYVVYILRGYQEIYGDMYSSLQEIVRAEYLEEIQQFATHEIDLNQLNAILIPKLIANEGAVLPRKLFEEAYIDQFRDTTSQVFMRLEENDTYRWVPQHPMRMYYCEADEQVSFTNAITASAYMNQGGAEDVEAVNLSSTAGHGPCAILAVLNSIAFFNQFDLISSAHEENEVLHRTYLFPNPVESTLYLQSELELQSLTLFDMQGRQVLHSANGITSWDVTHLKRGLYLARAINKQGAVLVQRVVKP